MGFLNRKRDEDILGDDHGFMFGSSERYEERKAKLKRAKEIASGMSSGMWERDEETWDMVKKLKDE